MSDDAQTDGMPAPEGAEETPATEEAGESTEGGEAQGGEQPAAM